MSKLDCKYKVGSKVKVVKNMAHYRSIEVGCIYEVTSVRGLGLWVRSGEIPFYLTFEEVELVVEDIVRKLVKCIEYSERICTINNITQGETYEVLEESVAGYTSYYRIVNDCGKEVEVFASRFEEVEPKDPYAEFRNLPVGTKIVLRDDLVIGDSYPTCQYTPQLKDLAGSILVIAGVEGGNYFMEGKPFLSYFSPEMIDRVITEVIEEPKGFEIIEVVKYNGEVLEEVPSDNVDGTTVYKSKQVGDTHRVVVYNHSKQEVTATWTVTKIV